MFDLFKRSGTLGLWKLTYCEGNHAECARFKLGKEGRRVPSTLLPNGRELPRVAGQ